MNTMIMFAVLLLGAAGLVTPELPGIDGVSAQPSMQRSSQEQGQRKTVDINKATVEQLQEVPGIGPALAQRIVDFRTEHGSFEKVDDLLNVRGIGTTTLDKLKPYLTIVK